MELKSSKTVIYSPYKLEGTEIDLITQKFNFIDKNNLENIIDKTIYAGVVIYHQNKIIDLSLKNKLNSLEKKLYGIDK